jgi:hypothetical protein
VIEKALAAKITSNGQEQGKVLGGHCHYPLVLSLELASDERRKQGKQTVADPAADHTELLELARVVLARLRHDALGARPLTCT